MKTLVTYLMLVISVVVWGNQPQHESVSAKPGHTEDTLDFAVLYHNDTVIGNWNEAMPGPSKLLRELNVDIQNDTLTFIAGTDWGGLRDAYILLKGRQVKKLQKTASTWRSAHYAVFHTDVRFFENETDTIEAWLHKIVRGEEMSTHIFTLESIHN